MSKIQVDTIVNKNDNGSPDFPYGATVTGIVTATNFSGNVTGTSTGLSGTPNLNVGVVTATSFVGSGANLSGLPAGFTELDAALFN